MRIMIDTSVWIECRIDEELKTAVKDFKCAWFDDRHYFEFFPLHTVYPK